MAPKLLDSYDMLFPTAQSLVKASILSALPVRMQADGHESLVAIAKIFETFRMNRRLFYCIPLKLKRVEKTEGLVSFRFNPADALIRNVK